jgi:hypothetical protein
MEEGLALWIFLEHTKLPARCLRYGKQGDAALAPARLVASYSARRACFLFRRGFVGGR